MLSFPARPKKSPYAWLASLGLHVAAVAALWTLDFAAARVLPRADIRSATIVLPAPLPRPAPAPPKLESPAKIVDRAEVAVPTPRLPRTPAAAAPAAPAIALEVEPVRLEASLPEVRLEAPAEATRPPAEFGSLAPRVTRREEAAERPAGFTLASLDTAPLRPRLPVTSGFAATRAAVARSRSAGPGAAAGFGAASSADGGPAAPTVSRASGFGGATAAASEAERRAPTESSGFSAAAVGAAPAETERPEEPRPARPPKILAKPRPLYTEAARASGVEGEAVLEVLLAGSGEVRVLRVIEGLGYGLDENAAEAARRVRFEPALRDGLPVDAVVTMRILFQLAL